VIVDRSGATLRPATPASMPVYEIASAAAPTTFVTDPRMASSGVDLTPGGSGPDLLASTAAATLPSSGPLAANYTLLLRVGEAATQHVVATGSLDGAGVARALAADINVNAPDGFTALTDGTNLYIVNRKGTSFELANQAEPEKAGAAVLVDLAGTTLFAGEVWTIMLDDSTFATTHSHVVVQGETLADVARELAKSIVAGGIVTFTATSRPGTGGGAQVVITNLEGQTFIATVEVTPVGQVSIVETRKFNAPAVDNHYFYRPVNLNTRVDEADQVDTMIVYNGNSPADDEGVLTADQLTGLGMAGDTVIAGRTLPGGIVYRGLEVLTIELGSGNDIFHVVSTHTGATNIDSGAGNDQIFVQSIDGHTTIDAADGDDVFRVGSEAAPHLLTTPENLLVTVRALLTVIGGAGNDSLYVDNGSQILDSAGILTATTLTGLGMPSVSEVQTIFVQAAAGVYTLRIADKTIDSRTATTTMIGLSGTPISGDTWTLVIDDLKGFTTDNPYRYEYVVGGSATTVADIAAARAAAVNLRTGTTGLVAAAEGPMVLVVNPSGEAFLVAFEIVTSATVPVASVTRSRRERRGDAIRHAAGRRHLVVHVTDQPPTRCPTVPTPS
jgi:hypothetical protein